VPDGSQPALAASGLVSIEGFNTNPQGAADPWLPASATQTLGNNVDAYADHTSPDGYSNGDTRATTTSARVFDWSIDLDADPAATEASIKASVTQLFYTVNWLHDAWYDSGFDEAAGNAQADNMERGGLGGDVLRAEAQDNHFGGSRNNANMSTPSDGMSPRMQMYAWSGATTDSLTASGFPAPLDTNTAAFGPTRFDVSGQLVLVNDGVGATEDGCDPIQNNVAGRVVLVARGTCTFVQKATNVQAAGGIGMVVSNNAPGAGPPALGGASPAITIAVLSVTLEDGQALRAALQAAPVTVTLVRTTAPDRDGALDGLVVAHEWGHYLHHRLTDCGSTQCRGLSEGWGDFLALHTTLRDGDNLNGTYADASWAARSEVNGAYFGLRRFPYSVDVTRNPLTLVHIEDGIGLPTGVPIEPSGNENSEVHNTGEIWATMLLQAYVALIQDVTGAGGDFAAARRTMADYVVAGLMMTPPDSTFTEARDGILAAAYAANPAHAELLARAFALRGNGSCAVAPERYADDNGGVVEGYTLAPVALLGVFQLSDDQRSCDGDGVLDGDEQGVLRIPVQNFGPQALVNAELVVTSTSAGVANPGAATYPVPTVAPFSEVVVEVPMALDVALAGPQVLSVGVRLNTPDACITVQTSTVVSRSNVDERVGAQLDDAEATRTAWSAEGADADQIWYRAERGPLSFMYHADDFSSESDTAFVSPTLQVSATGTFEVHLMHRYAFEADAPDGSGTNWDGAVVEISGDDGQTWEDVSTWVNPGYRGVLTNVSGNPLADRPALVGTSTAWPDFQAMHLSFGSAFAGQQVRLRFRIGTDAAANDYGMDLDDIQAVGIDNAPFYQVVVDTAECPPEVVADAGPDQSVGPGAAVLLDASASASQEGLPLTFAWRQVSGPAVSLTSAASAVTAFTAPSQETASTVVLEVEVSDGTNTATDQVSISVSPVPAPTLTADAGQDQTVNVGDRVVLDGANSRSSANVALTFAWSQVSGPQVTLQGTDRPAATFTAPDVTEESVLEFSLTVSDGPRSTSDRIRVTILAPEAPAPLVAKAGDDVTVNAGAAVILDGGESTGPAGLTFAWAQVDGPTVTAQGTGPVLAFTAPIAATMSVLTFELTVSADGDSATDTVVVTVRAQVPTNNNNNGTGGDEDSGCGCSSTGRGEAPGAAWAGLALLGLLFVRRRR
jgi:MYXO-CTERM domain-containing protein